MSMIAKSADALDLNGFNAHVRLLDTLAVGADDNAKAAKSRGDRASADASFREKNQYLNELVERGAADVRVDSTCNRGMVSVSVPVTGGRHHMPAASLSRQARERLACP